ncbi:regulatory signaling modulator protein AmpE [Alkalimarinus alittae]|uniref:Regulatory signaling modulator protein AmpE n=1 Tax=Alkalimarinus alittae TaxID=2961619 RepID=A0ABY6MYR4_9ALTE|nr:regulatory signaling modulator protein AmpE [Alkalimarinus alittae]UZE94992.1 regulatory signaling modulator protein AmpE [Alkalimarinus alittae]
MSLIALLISYFLQQKMDLPLSSQFDRITLKILRPDHFSIMAKRNSAAFLLLLLILLAYFSFSYVLFFLVEGTLWGFTTLLLEIAVLLFTLGKKGFKDSLASYLSAWTRGDFDAASFKQQELSGVNARLLRNPAMMQNEVSSAFLYHNFNRFFVITFWFVVGGPAMAVVARVADLVAQHSSHQLRRVAIKVNRALEWLPARLLGVTFTLVGNFKGSISVCVKYLGDVSTDTPTVLRDVAACAIDSFYIDDVTGANKDPGRLIVRGVDSISGVRGLLSRSMAFWLGVFALIVIVSY